MENKPTPCEFIGSAFDGERFVIDGINVWEQEWINSSRAVAVRDPRYNGKFIFPIYEIITPEKKITFAAGEFSNSVFGFFRI